MSEKKQESLATLHQKWISGQATEEEVEAFFSMLKSLNVDEVLAPLMKEQWEKAQNTPLVFEENKQAIVDAILQKHPAEPEVVEKPKVFTLPVFFKYAAAVAVIVGSLYFLLDAGKERSPEQAPGALVKEDKFTQPAHDGTLLELGNGEKLELENTGNGKIIVSEGQLALQKEDGTIIRFQHFAANHKVENTLTAPRGGMYQLTLPDGTEVWVNAMSSITFPMEFSEKERLVKIKGEVFFDVAKDAEKPFKIDPGNGLNIEVLGTSFNVSAYVADSDISTTVVDGSVKVEYQQKGTTLVAGQQLQVNNTGRQLFYQDVDVSSIIAWKNDEFHFGEKTDFKTVMKAIARWYDVEVVYLSEVETHFGGTISRKLSMDKVVELIGKAGDLKLTVQENKIYVE